MMCEFPRINEVKSVCAAFGVDKAQTDVVSEFYEFVKKTARLKAKERAEKAAKNTEKRKKEQKGD